MIAFAITRRLRTIQRDCPAQHSWHSHALYFLAMYLLGGAAWGRSCGPTQRPFCRRRAMAAAGPRHERSFRAPGCTPHVRNHISAAIVSAVFACRDTHR